MRLPASLFASFALLTLVAAPSCAAQQAQQPQKPAEKPFVLEAGELKIAELLDKSAAYLHWNILWNEQELTAMAAGGSIYKLQQRTETDAAGCEELLASLLSQKGFALVPIDPDRHVHDVVSMNGPRAREVMNHAPTRTPDQVLARPNLRMPVLTVVELRHINATVATNALRQFFASTGSPNSNSLTLGNAGNNTAILLTGFQDQVAAAVRLLQSVDLPPRENAAPGIAERLERIEARLDKIEKQLGKGEKDDKDAEQKPGKAPEKR